MTRLFADRLAEHGITVNEILGEIKALAGSDVEPIHEDPRPGDIRHSQADITRAREKMSWEPMASFSEGLQPTIDWYRDNLVTSDE